MKSRLAASIALAGALAGCVAGPEYVKPEMALPTSYRAAEASELDAPVANDLAEWWTAFEDPHLTRLVARALEQNLDLSQAVSRVAQARAAFAIRNSALLPSSELQAQSSRARQSIETPLGQALDSTPNFDRYGNLHETNLVAQWELDLFGGLRREREEALAEYQAAHAGVVASRIAVAAQTADIYISIRGLQAQLAIAREQVRIHEDLLSLTKLLFAKNLGTENDVWLAEGTLFQVRSTVPTLKSELENAMNALNVMLGSLPGTHRDELEGDHPIPAAPRLMGIGSPGELLRRRPDLIAAERRLAAANARIGSAMAEYYPTVSLSGLLGSATVLSSGNLMTSGASQSAVALGLRWRLFDFARINADIKVAESRESEALAAYRLAVLGATGDVESSLTALEMHRDHAGLLSQSVDALTRSRAATFAAFHHGTLSFIEVLRADEKLMRASDAKALAQAGSARAAVAAFKALGGGWRPDSFGRCSSMVDTSGKGIIACRHGA